MSIAAIRQCVDEMTTADLTYATQRARSTTMKAKQSNFTSFTADLEVHRNRIPCCRLVRFAGRCGFLAARGGGNFVSASVWHPLSV